MSSSNNYKILLIAYEYINCLLISKVPPAELEGILLTNTKIKTAAVVGIPDEAAGELPMAFVVKQPNVDLTENEVIDYVKGERKIIICS